MTTTLQLLELADAFGARVGLTRATLGTYVVNDGKFFVRMADEGTGCTLRTAERVLAWFSAHWPSDLSWPEDIPRPAVPVATEGGRG